MSDLKMELHPTVRQGATRDYARSESIFSRLKKDFDQGLFGWVGDFEEFALGYLTFASVLHADVESISMPVGSFVIGETSTGKSQFLESIALTIPDERVITLTSASSKALIYECRGNPRYLNGKVVFVEELSGLKNPEIQYLLRVLLTKGYAVHTTVMSGEAEKIEIFGAISLQSTGLVSDILREDNMNRLVIFESDSSEQKTLKVIDVIKDRYKRPKVNKSHDFSFYHDFFRSLTPKPVIIPYIDHINFDGSKFSSRRSSKIFFDLLSTVALLNQKKRRSDGAGNLLSEEEDLEILLSFSTKKTEQTIPHDLSPAQAVVHKASLSLGAREFTYQDIVTTIGENIYELSSIKKAMSRLIQLGLVEVAKQGRPVLFKVKGSDKTNRFGVIR